MKLAEMRLTTNERARKFMQRFATERLKLLYMWIKQGAIDFNEFEQLVELHVQDEEQQRAMGAD